MWWLDDIDLEQLIMSIIQSPRVIEETRRFAAQKYAKDPINATMFSDSIYY